MPGFRISRDFGKTWEPSPHTPERPLFPEPVRPYGPVKIGSPHFVDFGRNMEASPDGKAYLVAHGSTRTSPPARYAHNSWITGDQICLLRVKPSPETINDLKAYEFFAGHAHGRSDARPACNAVHEAVHAPRTGLVYGLKRLPRMGNGEWGGDVTNDGDGGDAAGRHVGK